MSASSSSSTTATATDEPDPEIFIAQANALPDLQWLAVAELLPYEELLTFGFGSAAFAYRFLGKPRTDAVPLDVVATSSMLSLLLRRDYGIAGTHAACEPMPYELRQLAIVAYHRHIGRDEGVFSRALIMRARDWYAILRSTPLSQFGGRLLVALPGVIVLGGTRVVAQSILDVLSFDPRVTARGTALAQPFINATFVPTVVLSDNANNYRLRSLYFANGILEGLRSDTSLLLFESIDGQLDRQTIAVDSGHTVAVRGNNGLFAARTDAAAEVTWFERPATFKFRGGTRTVSLDLLAPGDNDNNDVGMTVCDYDYEFLSFVLYAASSLRVKIAHRFVPNGRNDDRLYVAEFAKSAAILMIETYCVRINAPFEPFRVAAIVVQPHRVDVAVIGVAAAGALVDLRRFSLVQAQPIARRDSIERRVNNGVVELAFESMLFERWSMRIECDAGEITVTRIGDIPLLPRNDLAYPTL